MRLEKKIRAEIERALGSYPCLLLLSNPSGKATFTRLSGSGLDTDVSTAPIDFGLGGKGGPDLIGMIHWGKEISGVSIRGCQLIGIECKAPKGTRSEDQIRWHLKAEARGMWILQEATSADQAKAWLDLCLCNMRLCGLEPHPADPETLAKLRARRGSVHPSALRMP